MSTLRVRKSRSRSPRSRASKHRPRSVITFRDRIITEYNGPEKDLPKRTESNIANDEDVRNPVTFKSQVDLRKTDFDLYDTTQLVLGPTTGVPNYSYFTTRIEKVYIYMLLLCTFTSVLIAILLYTHFILPDFVYAKKVLVDFFASKTVPVLFHTSLPPIFLLLVTLFNVAVVQYHKADSWKKFAPVRWVIFIGVEVYLLTAALYYVSQVPPFAGKIETTMRRDFDYKYRNVTNDSTLSSVYRWVQGSRIDHVQIYYQCCGLDSWKDWKPVLKYWRRVLGKQSEKYIHGELCTKRHSRDIPFSKSEFAKNKIICQVPHTCWVKGRICSGVKDKHDHTIYYTGIKTIFDGSCLYWEIVTAYTVAATYIFFLVSLIVFSSFVFWKTRTLIEVANKMKVDLYTRPQFEECL